MIRIDGWLAVLAIVAFAATCLWLLRRQRQPAEALRETRIAAHGLADLLDVWQWRTGPDHCLKQLRPPQGAPAAAWAAVPPGVALWTHLHCADEAALRACLDAHAPLADVGVTFDTASGSLASGRLRGSALVDAQGRFAGYLGTLRVLGSELAAPVAGVAAADDASAPDSVLDSERESFSYTVSHDLRAPIRVVEGFTKILKEDYGRLLDRIGNDHLERVLGAAARMNSMIDALLALSQLSTQPLVRQPVNLSQLAGYITDDLRRQSPDREVEVVIESGLQVQGDPTLLRVALENLLGNAWK